MIIFPAIDLKEGRCVRLMQGDMERATVYGDDPAAMARRWQDEGAEWLHVVDLDGAFAKSPRNRDAIESMAAAITIPMQVGGGVRDVETLKGYLDLGVQRVILGTAALRQPELVEEACARFPQRVALGIDARAGKVAVEGWSETTDADAVTFAKRFEGIGLAAIIYTDIQRDGMQSGVNIDATGRLLDSVTTPVIASGGVATLADIENLLPLAPRGLAGVITGRALYAGTLRLGEAIEAARRQ